MSQKQPVPTKEQLDHQIQQLIVQRAVLKDQVEQIEKALPTLNAQVNLLRALEQQAAPEVVED